MLGSRYNADFPIVPLDKVQAELNMDMVGRDDCNDLEGDYTNSVFLVGDDRISTDLHNMIIEANQAMTKPLTLDYEMNDPADPEGVYTRSDHYSYASKGIPIAFFTTGLHPDYHRVSDSVEKILFPKMARIGQLMYEIRLCDRGDRAGARARQQGTAGWLRESGRDHQEMRAGPRSALATTRRRAPVPRRSCRCKPKAKSGTSIC